MRGEKKAAKKKADIKELAKSRGETPATLEVGIKVGEVCVVTETRRGSTFEYLYGIWCCEDHARSNYGEPADGYGVRFDVLPIWTEDKDEVGAK